MPTRRASPLAQQPRTDTFQIKDMRAMTRQLDDERVRIFKEFLGADHAGALGVRQQLLARHAVERVEVHLVDAADALRSLADVGLEVAGETLQKFPVRVVRGVDGERGHLVLQQLEERGGVGWGGADARVRCWVGAHVV